MNKVPLATTALEITVAGTFSSNEQSSPQAMSGVSFFLEGCIRHDSKVSISLPKGRITQLLGILLQPLQKPIQLLNVLDFRFHVESLKRTDERKNIDSSVLQVSYGS